jgi:hypothetical protein
MKRGKTRKRNRGQREESREQRNRNTLFVKNLKGC